MAAGGVRCARCGKPIAPGASWDLGHLDGSGKTQYAGPEHVKCNRSAGARVANVKRRRQTVARRVPRTSMTETPANRGSVRGTIEPESYRDDPGRGVYWGAPSQKGGPPRRWSRKWFDWRGSDSNSA